MLQFGSFRLATNLLLSPIAGYCDLAFRQTIRPLGGLGLACTDLLNPRGLLRQTVKSMEIVQTEPGDEPLCVQLYGREPDQMADAARWCADRGTDVLDINMGCPASKITCKAGGAALLREPELALRIAREVARAVSAPVTVKMRLGWDEASIAAPRLARAFEDVGVAGIIVHGRTAAQRFGGCVDLDRIAEVVQAVPSIPVIGNGDVRSPEDARRMIEHTGCAGVMIGRAALRDPWIFRDTHAFLTTDRTPEPPDVRERIALMNRHFEHLVRLRGERPACLTFRQRASWYTGTIGDCPQFRQGVRFIETADDYRRLVDILCDEDRLSCAFGGRRPVVATAGEPASTA